MRWNNEHDWVRFKEQAQELLVNSTAGGSRCRRRLTTLSQFVPFRLVGPERDAYCFRMSGGDDEFSPRLWQAIGVVRTQLGCSESEALAHMKTRIDRTKLTLEGLAPLIIERIVRFDG